ncbi:MAG TPA: tellurite resistance/C4-dicarboxylate transporter family protein [Gemmatimonadaceae bacterium]
MPDAVPRRGQLSEVVESLSPGYFALVMATGIVSLATHFLDLEAAAAVLFWINVVAYGVLCLLTLARLTLHRRRITADLSDHARGPGFFTLPAGTCVLGAQFVVLRGQPHVATILWFTGIALWAVVTYGFFAAVTMKAEKPPLSEGLNGTWLVAVVAMQSIAVLGCLVAPSLSSPSRVLFVAAAMHMGGFMLYLPLITLLLYRWMFFEFTPQQLTPPYWINMGALAISTLAGARLLQGTADLPLLQRITPFLQGATFFFWAAATWWIPLLVVLGFWRHVIRRVPFVYDPHYWGMVFPLGMYTTCTVQMARALDLPDLIVVARVFVWPALVAWLGAFVGLVLSLTRAAHRRT